MITRMKVRQIEDRFTRSSKGSRPIICHDITEDGRLLDKDDYVMTKQEVRLIEKEDEEIHKRGGIVFFLTSYCEPKFKTDSETVPYYVKPYKGEAPRKT